MKVRQCFVSNSSSSSFICDICGEQESGWDISLDEAEMFECENGHTMHWGCGGIDDVDAKEFVYQNKTWWMGKNYYNEEIEKWVDAYPYIETLEDKAYRELCDEHFDDEGIEYNVPSAVCPICNFKVALVEDVAKYIYKKYDTTPANVFTWVKANNSRRRKLRDSDVVDYAKEVLTIENASEEFLKAFSSLEEFYQWLS